MPITVLNDPHASWAGTGYAAGQGFGHGLEQLANAKLASILEQKSKNKEIEDSAKFWDSIPGINKDIAKGLSHQPKEFQMKVLESLGGVDIGDQGGQQFYNPQQQFQQHPEMAQQQAQQQMPNEQQAKQIMQEFLQGKNALQNLGYGQQINPQQGLDQLNRLLGQQQLQQQLQQPEQQEMAPKLNAEDILKQLQQRQQPGGQFNRPSPKLVLGAQKAAVEQRHLENLAQKQQEAEQKEIGKKFKETKEFRKEILDNAKQARSALRDLDRIEELSQEGKLDTPGYIEFLKNSGMDIPALMNPESEEFQKIAMNFMRDAKQYFGGRVSNYEIEQFLKTVPSLSQSPEGRKRVIANLKFMNRAALEYNDAYKEVMKENKNVPPYDLQEKVDDKIEKRLDKLSEKFKQELQKPVPPAQNKLVTALQSVAGKAAGATPKLLKGAAGAFTGAKLGARLGPIGAGIGGLVGGLGGLSGLV